MQFGLDIAQQRMPWAEVVSRAQFAESLGFDGVWGFDHFQPMYGDGPGECFEGVTTLAALTGVTERVRMGLLVTGMTYRHPSVFAAEAITVDHASGGRLELSYGAAWFEGEHQQIIIERLGEDGSDHRVEGSAFLPAKAEEIGHWVLRESTRDGSLWARRPRAWARAELIPRLAR